MSSDTLMIVWYAVGFLVWLATCYALGLYGSAKGYSFSLCFALGIVATPLVALIVIALLPEREGRKEKGGLPPNVRLAMDLEKARMAAAKGTATS